MIGMLWFLDCFNTISAAPYALIFSLVKSFILNAPTLFGGYEGIDYLDVCSQITGVSSSLLIKNADICDERISTYIHSRCTIVITAIIVLVLSYSFTIFKIAISTIQLLKKDERNKLRNQKSNATKRNNKTNDKLLSQVRLILFSNEIIDDTTKVKLLIETLGNNHTLVT